MSSPFVISCTQLKIPTAQHDSPVPKQFSHSSLCFLVDHVLASQIKTVEETLWVKPTPIWVNHLAAISCSQFKIRTAQHDSPVPKQFSHSSLCFLVDHVLASQIKTVEETLWVKPTPIWVNHLAAISCSQFKIRTAQHDSPVPKQFSHSSLCFFGGPCLSITDKDCGRDFMGEANSNLSQPFVTHLLYTFQNPYSSAWRSSFRNSFHTLLFYFWWTTS